MFRLELIEHFDLRSLFVLLTYKLLELFIESLDPCFLVVQGGVFVYQLVLKVFDLFLLLLDKLSVTFLVF